MEINRFQVLVDALKLLSEIDGKISNEAAVIAIFDNYTKNWNVNNYKESNYKKLYYQGLNPSAVQKIEVGIIDEDKFKNFINMASDIQKESIGTYLSDSLELKEDIEIDRLAYFCVNLMSELIEESKYKKNVKKQKKPTGNSELNKAEDIGLTIKDEKGIFEETFNQIKEIKLSYKNSGMRAFALLPVSGMYSHKNLIKLLRKNLARYIFSRKNRAESDDLEELTAEATSELRDFVRECNPQTLLGELLIYIFLEHCERAPKIFTKAEFYKERKSVRQKSIFLREDNGGWQLIVGAANLNETMEVTISEALKECKELKNESDFGGGSYSTRFFQNSDLDNRFSTEQIKKIESIMFPSPDVQESTIQVESYGIFLGYQADNLDGNELLEDRLKEDAEKAVGMISDAVSGCGLRNHPIYVYLLPFKNLKYESDQIIDKLVGR
ncbi:Hachiman antiphage defense system protein HamA [Limosilactobacillus fermentum]